MTERNYSPPQTISRESFLRYGNDSDFRTAIYLYLHSASRLLNFRDVFSGELNLTPSQFVVLMGVADQQENSGVTIKGLSAHVALAATHVTTEVARLENKGLLIKRPNETDRRSVKVSLSTEGEKSIDHISPLIMAINDILFADISELELKTVREVAIKLTRNSEDAMDEVRRRLRQAKSK